jgi:hypothetical protein
MKRSFAQYLTCLIAKDLESSYNGKGLCSYLCEAIENYLTKGEFDKVLKFVIDIKEHRETIEKVDD